MLQLGDGDAARFLLGVSEDVTEARMFARKLEKLALEDSLTGLANRAAFIEGLNAAMRGDDVVALAFLDVDNFKDINDTGGHSAGDALLRQLAARLTSALPTHWRRAWAETNSPSSRGSTTPATSRPSARRCASRFR